MRELLELVYAPDAIYLQEIAAYSVKRQWVTGRFTVPGTHSYTRRPIAYVTAEQYVRCLSQLSYVLMGFLIQDGAIQRYADYETFKWLMAEHKMWFRKSDLRYRKNVPKEKTFELSLALKEVGTLREFAICFLQIDGVVDGELEFVTPLSHGK
jgi:hypothetical protein